MIKRYLFKIDLQNKLFGVEYKITTYSAERAIF